MATWVVGDIHGCADELRALVASLGLGSGDRLVALGDLFHRGPDAAGVMDLLREAGASFVLGNHEDAVLRRTGLAPTRADGADRPPLRSEFPPLQPDDLAGDGRRPLSAPTERLGEILRFLQGHSGYALSPERLPGAGPCPDGRSWWVVHAGIPPSGSPLEARLPELLYPGRRSGRFWFESYAGPELVLFGHMPAEDPREVVRAGVRVAIGLDTGCVYGGRLTAYSPELDRFESVPARRAYAEM